MVVIYKELVSENNFEAILSTFCCYDYDVNASEAVQKVTIDQTDYQRLVTMTPPT